VKFGAKRKKNIIIGLGIVAALALSYTLILQQPEGEGLIDTVELNAKMIRAQREAINLEGVYESRLQLYNSRLEENRSRLLPGDNPNVAGAELLNTLTDFANKNGVEITLKRQRPEPKADGPLLKVTAFINTSCNMEQFVRLLADIANYEKFLTVDELTIATNTRPARGGQVNVNMSPSLTVSGYMRAEKIETEEKSKDTNL
jgi:hypothetical protein